MRVSYLCLLLIVTSGTLMPLASWAGGELPKSRQMPPAVGVPAAPAPAPAGPSATPTPTPKPHKPIISRPFRGIPAKKIGPPAGKAVAIKDAPLPSPERPVGWGANCNEFYGPTYYYPWYHNEYEGLNPTYYPFFHPRGWANYKTDAMYCNGQQCGPSRSLHYWDSYDDWSRGGRYDERQ